MKKEELIRKLSQLPDNSEVCIMDYLKNIESDSGEGSSEGIYTDFEIQYMGEKEVTKDSKNFVALIFENLE